MTWPRRKKVLLALGIALALPGGLYIAALVWFGTGFSKTVYRAYLEVETAKLTTPEGEYALAPSPVASQRYGTSLDHPLMLMGGPDHAEVEFVPTSHRLRILHRVTTYHRGEPAGVLTQRPDVSFPPQRSFYRRGSESPRVLDVDVVVTQQQNASLPSVRYDLRGENPFAEFNLRYSGGSLRREVAEQIRQHEDVLHTYHFEFLAGDEPHTMDVAFYLKVDEARVGAVPGTP